MFGGADRIDATLGELVTYMFNVTDVGDSFNVSLVPTNNTVFPQNYSLELISTGKGSIRYY